MYPEIRSRPGSCNIQRRAALTKDEAWKLANDWTAAWNAHDLDLILSHYEEGVELTSPVAARLLGKPGSKVTGQARSEEHTSELQSRRDLVCRLLLEKKKK